MLSSQARDGFDRLFMQALATSLAAPGRPGCDVSPVDSLAAGAHDRAVLLTISSYRFRLLTLIHFSLDAGTREHLASIANSDAVGMDERQSLDVIAECGNICCGALNRSLGAYFPHTGMSTPNVLNPRSIPFLPALSAGYLRHFQVRTDGGPTLQASLCVCADAPIDFAVSPTDTSAAAEATGELEMF